MKKYNLFITIFLTFCFISFSNGQVLKDINRYDSNHKKDGKWIMYRDNKMKAIKDSAKASFCNYTFYQNGDWIMKEMNYPHVRNIMRKMEYIGNDDINKKPHMLNGEYKWYDKKGRLLCDLYYRYGDCIFEKYYYWGSFNKKMRGQKMKEVYDYSRKIPGQMFSCYTEYHKKNGKVKKYVLTNGRKGWAFNGITDSQY